ncbi:MAG TPA: hypothetical protein EYO33_32620 [Phycisphaerales bacterium]|nr:hypothetical protein [Phycisphaerales bacterium]
MSDISRFRISVGDDDLHEDLTAEIYFDEKFLALVSQENGLDKAEIELQRCPDSDAWDLPLDAFLKVLEQAKYRLWELRRQ